MSPLVASAAPAEASGVSPRGCLAVVTCSKTSSEPGAKQTSIIVVVVVETLDQARLSTGGVSLTS